MRVSIVGLVTAICPALCGQTPSDNSATSGWRLFNEGRIRDALVAFNQASSAGHEGESARRGLAWSLLRLGQVDKAEPLFRQLHAAHPRDPETGAGLALCQLRRGDFAAATTTTYAVLSAGPIPPPPREPNTNHYLQPISPLQYFSEEARRPKRSRGGGDLAAAEHLEILVTTFPIASHLPSDPLFSSPGDLTFRTVRTMQALYPQDMTWDLMEAWMLLHISTDERPSQSAFPAGTLLHRDSLHITNKALAKVEEVLEANPEHHDALLMRININLRKQAWKPAILDLRRAVALWPQEQQWATALRRLEAEHPKVVADIKERASEASAEDAFADYLDVRQPARK